MTDMEGGTSYLSLLYVRNNTIQCKTFISISLIPLILVQFLTSRVKILTAKSDKTCKNSKNIFKYHWQCTGNIEVRNGWFCINQQPGSVCCAASVRSLSYIATIKLLSGPARALRWATVPYQPLINLLMEHGLPTWLSCPVIFLLTTGYCHLMSVSSRFPFHYHEWIYRETPQ